MEAENKERETIVILGKGIGVAVASVVAVIGNMLMTHQMIRNHVAFADYFGCFHYFIRCGIFGPYSEARQRQNQTRDTLEQNIIG